MRKLSDITNQIKNAMNKSRGLNDADFDKLLANIQFVTKNITQTRKRYKSVILECSSFREYVARQKVLHQTNLISKDKF